MPTKDSEKIKLYLVIGLSLVAAVVAYFRFIHKGNDLTVKIAQAPPAQSLLDLTPIITAGSQRSREYRQTLTEPLDMEIRDIFAPPQLPQKPKPPAQSKPSIESKPVEKASVVAVPALPLHVELKGTVVGGNEPLAIINDKFVRLGEKVGDYQVVGITPTAVYLKAGKHQRVLHVMSGAAQ